MYDYCYVWALIQDTFLTSANDDFLSLDYTPTSAGSTTGCAIHVVPSGSGVGVCMTIVMCGLLSRTLVGVC